MEDSVFRYKYKLVKDVLGESKGILQITRKHDGLNKFHDELKEKFLIYNMV